MAPLLADAGPPLPPPSPTAPAGRSLLRQALGDAAVVFGLWGLAVAQPLLDLYGNNGELFVAAHAPGGAIVAFAVTITIVPPFVLAIVQGVVLAVHRGAGRALHTGLTAVLGTLLAATLLRRAGLDATLAVIVPAVATGVALAWGERRSRGVATALRYLAVGPIVFLAAFTFASQSSRLIFDGGSTVNAATGVARPAPVVILQLDELPLASLLDDDLQVNGTRFSGFAALADESTWYPDATANASQTSFSVPSVVTGRLPDPDALPTATDHPRSVFTLLAGHYDLDVHEAITNVCPDSLCADDRERGESFPSLLADAGVVYGHVVLPASWREDLPRVDQAWAGFVDGVRPAEEGSPGATPSQPFGSDWADADAFARGPAGQGQELQGVIDTMGTGTGARPTLSYTHVLLPHEPWLMTPTDQQHSDTGPMLGMTVDGTWEDDPVGSRQGLQRHLLQLGYTDLYLGRMIQRLKDTGIWDDALVVVTADHGVAFTPGRSPRVPAADTLDEIYDVPLFIKYPHQTAGEVDPRNARLIDVLPTIVDVLDVETDWEFDGRSLRGPTTGDDTNPVMEEDFADDVRGGLAGVPDVVARNRRLLPYGDDWRGVAQVEPYGDLVGVPVDQLTLGEPSPMSFQTYHPMTAYNPDTTESPVLRSGRLHLAGAQPPTAGLITINGVVAGVAVGFTRDGDDATYSGIITPEFFTRGDNDLGLLVPDEDGGRVFHAVTLVEDSDP